MDLHRSPGPCGVFLVHFPSFPTVERRDFAIQCEVWEATKRRSSSQISSRQFPPSPLFSVQYKSQSQKYSNSSMVECIMISWCCSQAIFTNTVTNIHQILRNALENAVEDVKNGIQIKIIPSLHWKFTLFPRRVIIETM